MFNSAVRAKWLNERIYLFVRNIGISIDLFINENIKQNWIEFYWTFKLNFSIELFNFKKFPSIFWLITLCYDPEDLSFKIIFLTKYQNLPNRYFEHF